jgi:hypothetical protein
MVIGSRLVWIAIASVVGLLVAGFATYFAVNAGDSSGGAPTVQQTTTTELSTTPPPLTEPPTETAPAPTEGPTPPSPSPTATFDSNLPPDLPPEYCDPPRTHLNVEKLRAQPNLTGAVITEVDLDTVRVEIKGVEMFVNGWGGLVGFDSNGATDQLFEQVATAVNAVRFEC